ncbi:MAG: hypothetical protein QXU81_00170 [Candidatus Bathyarchaeia archaeon]
MSYSNMKRNRMYDIRRQFNKQFRELWERGLREAEKKAISLEKQGWTVDVERGALTRDQGRKILAHIIDPTGEGLEQADFITVAKIDDKEVGFIAYKPKPKEEKKEEAKSEPPAIPDSTIIMNRFISTFNVQNDSYIDKKNGVVFDPLSLCTYIARDSLENPDKIDSAFLRDKARSALHLAAAFGSVDYFISLNNDAIIDNFIKKLEEAKKEGKKYLALYEDPSPSIAVPAMPIDAAIKLFNVLRGQICMTISVHKSPTLGYSKLALVRLTNGDAILIDGERVPLKDNDVISITKIGG